MILVLVPGVLSYDAGSPPKNSPSPPGSQDPIVPINYAQAFAKNISPVYAHKLQQRTFQVDVADLTQRDVYRKKSSTVITVFWWATDSLEPHKFGVPVPLFPYFHPRDDPAIVAVVGKDQCTTYSWYDGESWVTTSLPQTVNPVPFSASDLWV
ncbi:hypothetical protein C8J57DRAFT_1251049 [Mycena rebaudengoi]|nr:hypothetical protein C8J57DRAFT_1251049 [Mycena rebaudengoi]